MAPTRPAAEAPSGDAQSSPKRARIDGAAANGSTKGEGGTGSAAAATTDVTEDEAALYDRQIRLWGLEAQNRMRKAHVLVHNLEGIATETIKNIVLSGIGTLTIVDDKAVEEEDLSSGFFFREDDVGKLRIDAAAPRIQALNPLVKINTVSDTSVLKDADKLRDLGLDTLVTTSGSKAELVSLNSLCRSIDSKFYAAQSQGLGAWLFVDLGKDHTYMVEKSVMVESGPSKGSMQKKKLRYTQGFVPLEQAIQKEWTGLKEKQKKRLRPPTGYFATLAHWEEPEADAAGLQERALRIAEEEGFTRDHLFPPSNGSDGSDEVSDFFSAVHGSFAIKGDFAPTSAVIGGLLAQDVLNSLGGREAPIANWLQLDGMGGNGTIIELGCGQPQPVA